jgi:hypothetical protein
MQRERRPRPIIAFPAIIGYSRKPRTRRIVPFWDSFCLAGKRGGADRGRTAFLSERQALRKARNSALGAEGVAPQILRGRS